MTDPPQLTLNSASHSSRNTVGVVTRWRERKGHFCMACECGASIARCADEDDPRQASWTFMTAACCRADSKGRSNLVLTAGCVPRSWSASPALRGQSGRRSPDENLSRLVLVGITEPPEASLALALLMQASDEGCEIWQMSDRDPGSRRQVL